MIRSCPEWPRLMEVAPDLQFKHYRVSEARLPGETVVALEGVSLDDLELCCDLDHHVFNPEHTDSRVVAALRTTHWFDLAEWSTSGPGAGRP